MARLRLGADDFLDDRPMQTFEPAGSGTRTDIARQASPVPPAAADWLSAGRRAAAIGITGLVSVTIAVACDAARLTPAPTQRSPIAPDVRLVASEFSFDQPTLRVAPGQRVTIDLENRGKIEHNLRVEGSSSVQLPGKAQLDATPGQLSSADFTFDGQGEFDFFCTIPGHREAGMSGKLIVGDLPIAHAQHSAGLDASAAATTAPQPAAETVVQPLPGGLTRLPQPAVAPPVHRTEPATVDVQLETREVTALLSDGIAYRYWTFNGTVPGPMIRVRQGDTVNLHLTNLPQTRATHSINLHAVSGPGGGAWATQVGPSGDGGISFLATRPGIYVYHCMTAPVGQHVSNGMYGMVVVEPPGGLPPVDDEWYMMEGDIYLKGDRGLPGLREFSFEKLLAEQPDYTVFNGSVGALTGERALRARVHETVRIFFGVGGPSSDSAFHVVGGIFDRLHPEGAVEALTDVQTTLVPPGGSTMAELTFDAPGHYMIEDHHIARLEKGAMADVEVDGAPSDVFRALGSTTDQGPAR